MYNHTQIGWVIIISIMAGIFLSGVIFFINADVPTNWITLSIMLILFLSLLLFYALTVTVDDKQVSARLGIGLFRKRILLKDIESVEEVKNKWWYGWGIRFTNKGLMYNVSGFGAVQFYLKNKKKFRIGSDEPEELVKFIKSKISAK